MLPYAPEGSAASTVPVGGGEDRLAVIGRDVEPGVIAAFARERIAAAAEAVGQPPARRPDGRRRRGERVPPLDVGLHDLQPALEAVEQVAQHAESVFRRADDGREQRRLRSARGARLHDRRQAVHRLGRRRIDGRPERPDRRWPPGATGSRRSARRSRCGSSGSRARAGRSRREAPRFRRLRSVAGPGRRGRAGRAARRAPRTTGPKLSDTRRYTPVRRSAMTTVYLR